MAKIGKIRFVNFVYNENRHIYDQTFDFFNGEDTLLNLQNGGGKTVLVQMMMQPIVPKLKLKDRVFKNYFANTKAPCYILIEWILDGQTKRVMTGIGVKRVVSKNIEDESDSLKVITFLSEYEGESGFDIKNIELLEAERGIVRLIEFDKVIKNLSTREKEGEKVWLFRWELPDDKKEYNRRLLEYKINPTEWKNLMVRINESEAGLNSFFNDCKTNNALIKKWFVPTIEEQLNKNGNFIENVKELIKNHALQRVKNENMMKEREIYDRFRTKSAGLVKKLEDYEKLLEKTHRDKFDLGNAWVYIQKQLTALDRKKEELTEGIKQAEGDSNHLEYEKMSGEYHATSQELEALKARGDELEQEITEQSGYINQLENKKKLFMGLRFLEELKDLNSKIANFETELEKENLKQEDQRTIILDIEYSLKEIYGEKAQKAEEKLLVEEKLLEEENLRLLAGSEKLKALKKEMTSLQEELIAVSSRVAVFKEREKALRAAYPDLTRGQASYGNETASDNLGALKESLLLEEEEIQNAIEEEKKNQELYRKASEEAEKKRKEAEEKQQELAVWRNKAENAYELFEKDKKAMEKLLKSYQLKEDSLFDKEKITALLKGEAEKYNRLFQERGLENSILKKQLKQYESESVLELPEEIGKTLEDNGIFVEYGYEWLKSLPEDKREKQRLVKNNPFLPASLIVSGKDLAKIKSLEFYGTLPSFVPILEREKLKETLAVKSGKNTYAVGEAEFLIAYDDKILNKNYLKEVMEEITLKMDRNQETMDRVAEALKNTELERLRAESFSYTKEEAEKLTEDINNVEEALKANEEKLLGLQKGLLESGKSISEGYKEINRLEHGRSSFQRKKEDIFGLIDRYEEYKKDVTKRQLIEENQKDYQKQIKAAEEDMEKVRIEIQDRERLLLRFRAALEENSKLYQRYCHAKPAGRLKEEPEKLEARLKVLVSETSGKIHNLQGILEDYRRRRDEKKKEMKALDLEEEAYLGKEYKEYELGETLKKLAECREKQMGLQDGKNNLQVAAAEKASDLKYVGRIIRERYSYETPMPEEAVRNLDFDREKKSIEERLKKQEKELSFVKGQGTQLEKILFPLEEYKEFGNLADGEFTAGDNLKEKVVRLIKEYKESEGFIREGKELLTAAYFELETEFTGKSEMFKALFHSILDGEKRYQPVHAHNALNRVYLQIDRKLEQHSIDLKKIDDMEKGIIDNTLSYLKNVYDEMNSIDKNSVIEVDGRKCKMLLVELPDKEELDSLSLKEYLKETIRKCEGLYKQEKSPENLLLNEINTYDLFDRLAGMNKIHINLMKIEPNRLKKKTWKQVIEENSGGEKFVNAFVVFISLLTYMRGDSMPGNNTQSKVLIMDNPFGPITSEHLLKPLFEISKKYNTQMICLSDLKEHTIYDRFNLIYSLNIEREVGREEEYIEQKTIKKDVQSDEDEMVSASLFKIDDLSRFERIN